MLTLQFVISTKSMGLFEPWFKEKAIFSLKLLFDKFCCLLNVNIVTKNGKIVWKHEPNGPF